MEGAAYSGKGLLMSSAFPIDGYAIASADGMIAGPDGVMPKSLQYEADHRFFEAALEKAGGAESARNGEWGTALWAGDGGRSGHGCDAPAD